MHIHMYACGGHVSIICISIKLVLVLFLVFLFMFFLGIYKYAVRTIH